jgi:SAM-dependent methyltransferase
MLTSCPICRGDNFDSVLSFADVAVHQIIPLNHKPVAADFSGLEIVCCQTCAHVFNQNFDTALNSVMYGDTPLSNMIVHVSMVEGLQSIASEIGVECFTGKQVIEIGAGTGHLARIFAQQASEVTVYEPCLGLKSDMLPEPNITLINEPFSSRLIDRPADLIVCRQVIEHINNPRDFILEIVANLATDGLAYLEVPRAEYIVDNAAIGDFHLAHIQYFSEANFITLCRQCDLDVIKSVDVKEGHDVGFLFKRRKSQITQDFSPKLNVQRLHQDLADRVLECQTALADMSGEIAFYGATRNGQAILELVGGIKHVSVTFDDNSEYAGYAIYNSEQVVPIEAPSIEKLSTISTIIIASYLHHIIIAEKLRDSGFTGKILTASPKGAPSNICGLESLFGP